MKRNGKNWKENVTFEWADNPPRRNSKANNRFCRELRKSIVREAGRHDFDIDDLCDNQQLQLDCAGFLSRLPRSLVTIIVDNVNEEMDQQASCVGASYRREKYNRYSSYRSKDGK